MTNFFMDIPKYMIEYFGSAGKSGGIPDEGNGHKSETVSFRKSDPSCQKKWRPNRSCRPPNTRLLHQGRALQQLAKREGKVTSSDLFADGWKIIHVEIEGILSAELQECR